MLGKHAHTSFLQRLPGAARYFRTLLPLFPRAIESLDVAGYDLVISVSHAVAKGVRTHAGQLHLCYCLTPMRYAWDLRETYLASAGATRGPQRTVANAILDRLQRWDVASSDGVDGFIAISEYIRTAHPPLLRPRCDGHLPAGGRRLFQPRAHATAAARLSDRVALGSVQAPGPHRRCISRDAGPQPDRRRRRPCSGRRPRAAGSNVEFVGEVSRERLRELMREARAFVFAAEEDFGIAPVEAQACGTPVIAFARGGVVETVRGLDAAQPTGVLLQGSERGGDPRRRRDFRGPAGADRRRPRAA